MVIFITGSFSFSPYRIYFEIHVQASRNDHCFVSISGILLIRCNEYYFFSFISPVIEYKTEKPYAGVSGFLFSTFLFVIRASESTISNLLSTALIFYFQIDVQLERSIRAIPYFVCARMHRGA